jgi:hypothetical protein
VACWPLRCKFGNAGPARDGPSAVCNSHDNPVAPDASGRLDPTVDPDSGAGVEMRACGEYQGPDHEPLKTCSAVIAVLTRAAAAPSAGVPEAAAFAPFGEADRAPFVRPGPRRLVIDCCDASGLGATEKQPTPLAVSTRAETKRLRAVHFCRSLPK